jgi:glycosyltransferase involved in cell wall biosynthesis
MQEVVRQLSERLVALGHTVTVATTALKERRENVHNGVHIRGFDVKGNLVRGIEGDRAAYEAFLLDGPFDVVVNFAAQQWTTDLALPLLDRIKARKVFVPTGFSGLPWPEYRDYFERMKVWMKGYDMNVFLSDHYRDIDFARANGITKTVLIPNGAGEDEFLAPGPVDIRQQLGIGPDQFLILHVGFFTGQKGQREAWEMFRRAGLRNAVLLLVGQYSGSFRHWVRKQQSWWSRGLDALRGRRLVVAGLNRAETVAAFQAADLFLFPSNIECSPIVLFEAMAGKTPFLVTDVGNSAEIIGWTGAGELLPTTHDEAGYSHADIDRGAVQLRELVADRGKRERMALAGYQAWREKYSWEKIVKQYEVLYLNLCANEINASVPEGTQSS